MPFYGGHRVIRDFFVVALKNFEIYTKVQEKIRTLLDPLPRSPNLNTITFACYHLSFLKICQSLSSIIVFLSKKGWQTMAQG